jgi:hypothetical protein
MRAIALLLKKEEASATALEAKVAATALQLAPTTTSYSVPPPLPSGGDTAVVCTLHAHAYGVQNICYLVSTILNTSSTAYTHW